MPPRLRRACAAPRLAGPRRAGPRLLTTRARVQNIVATCNLAVPLELKTIALHARNAEYNPKRFAAVIMRIRDP